MDASAVVSPPYLAGPLSLHPFRAHLLQPSRIGDPASGRLFSRPYRAVAERLTQWEERGRVSVDAEPALYLHEYVADGHTIRGLVGTIDLDHRAASPADSVVLPHEGIHPRQADELASRMEETQIHPAPILLVHQGSGALRRLLAELVETPPSRQFEDAGGQRHRLWTVRDPEEIAQLAREISGGRALIADGHHRYAAYLRMQARHPGTPADRGLAMLVDQADTPFDLHPIHRVLSGVRLDTVQTTLTGLGLHSEFRPSPAHGTPEPGTLVLSDGRRWAYAELPTAVSAEVEFVHDTLLPALPRCPRAVSHHLETEDAVEAAARRGGTALLLPPLSFAHVLDVVQAGRLLPEKATSFQPKPHTGTLMRSLRDE